MPNRTLDTELPPAPKPKIPSWVPAEYHDVIDAFSPGTFKENPSPEEQAGLLKVMARTKKIKGWPSIDDLRDKRGHVPKEMIDEVFDKTISSGEGRKSNGYSRDWQAAVLRHPSTDLDAAQLHEILHNKNLNTSIRAEAFLHGKAADNEILPREITAAHFVGGRELSDRASLLPDHKLSQVFKNHDMDDGYAITDAKYLIDQLKNKDEAPSRPFKFSKYPQTVNTILKHHHPGISGQLAGVLPLDEGTFSHLIQSTAPTLDGKPLSEEERKGLSLESDTGKTYDNDTLHVFYNENEHKSVLLERLAGNPHLTTDQIERLSDHVAKAIDISSYTYPAKMGTKLATRPNVSVETQRKLLQNHNVFLDAVKQDNNQRDNQDNYTREDSPKTGPGIKPEVFNELFPAAYERAIKDSNDDNAAYNSRHLLNHDHVSPDNIRHVYNKLKSDLEKDGKSDVGSYELINHPKTPGDVYQGLWDITQNPSEKERERLGGIKPDGSYQFQRINRIGKGILEDGKNVPPELITDIVRKADITNAKSPNLTDEHHKIMVEKAKLEDKPGGFEGADSFTVMKNVAHFSKNPDLIRDIHNWTKENVWDYNGTPNIYRTSNSEGTRQSLQNQYLQFADNQFTPIDVIEKIHKDFPDPYLMEHPNFPQSKIEEYANNLEDNDKLDLHTRANRDVARDKLKHIDPDKYSYKVGGPGTDNLKNNSEYGTAKKGRGADFGSVETKTGLAKLRVFRDKILEADPTKGELSPKQIGPGPFSGAWKPVQEKNGNVSAKKIQELIDSHPSEKYNFAHEEWRGAQRHSDHPQRVFKLNATTEHIRKMKEAGVYGTFKNLSEYSNQSGHPSDSGHTFGWVRYEHHRHIPQVPGKSLHPQDSEDEAQLHERTEAKQEARREGDTVHREPEAIHVDEIQTDMGPNTIAQLKEHPDRAREKGVEVEHLDKINEIAFGKHHPSEVLMEAFRQHHRNLGRHDIPIHMLDAKTKAPISGMGTRVRGTDKERPLPAHMNFTYNQMPKKMGFNPNKYGHATEEQDEPEHQHQPTWTDKIRKFEEELIMKALDDIKVGPKTIDFPREKQEKLPEGVGHGRVGYHDYNHLLTPQHKRAGYRLYVYHAPEHKLEAKLYHKGEHIGGVESVFNPYNSAKLSIQNSRIQDDLDKPKHRNKGLGTAAYEALLAHAKHAAGVEEVSGTSHSSMARSVHQKLAQKHGLAYAALPNYMEGTAQYWENKEDWDAAPSGPFDDKYGKYGYLLKNELNKGAQGDWKAEGYQIDHELSSDGKTISIKASLNGTPVGDMDAGHSEAQPGTLHPSMVRVDPAHRRKGIATAMYARAEQILGAKFHRGSYQSPSAVKLWAQKNRPFGKTEELDKTVLDPNAGDLPSEKADLLMKSRKEIDPDDFHDAVQYIADITDIDPGELEFQGNNEQEPRHFIDDTSHMGNLKAGWLRAHPEHEWAQHLKYEHDRPFEHIVAAYKAGTLAPAISINGQMGDGRGRALFHHALGLKMPVATFVSKSPHTNDITKSEHHFKGTAFKHKETGQVIETGIHHDITKLPEGEETNLDHWTEGFVDASGTFHDRVQAAKIVHMAKEAHHREWLDSYDPEAGLEKNEDGILALLEHDDPLERILALKSTNVQPHHILTALNDQDPQVRAYAASHPAINAPLLLECLRQCKDGETYNMLLNHESADDEHINHAIETNHNGNGGEIEPEDDQLA